MKHYANELWRRQICISSLAPWSYSQREPGKVAFLPLGMVHVPVAEPCRVNLTSVTLWFSMRFLGATEQNVAINSDRGNRFFEVNTFGGGEKGRDILSMFNVAKVGWTTLRVSAIWHFGVNTNPSIPPHSPHCSTCPWNSYSQVGPLLQAAHCCPKFSHQKTRLRLRNLSWALSWWSNRW